MAGSSFDDDGGGIRPDRPYRFDYESPPELDADGLSVAEDLDSRRGRIGRVMQKLFFPDQFAKEQLLLDLIEDLPQSRTDTELAHQLLAAVDLALSPEALHLFVRRATRFRLLHSTDRSEDGNVLLPPGSRLPTLAAAWHEPRATASLPDLHHDERAWLRAWRVRWVVPIRHPDPQVALRGLLLLGARQGGYSEVQRDLLQALASRLALELRRHVERQIEELRESRGRGGWLLECPECGRCYGDRHFFCDDDDATIEPTLLMERDIAGRYRLQRHLAHGGMGRVYRALDLHREVPVALKILTGGDPVALGRFANEARAGRKIRHPSVVEVIDSGNVGRYGAFLAMEFVDGITLRRALEQRQGLEPSEVAGWLAGLLDGVAAAHDVGVIHRDLKPENIMLVGGEAKVLDFGLAKMHDSSSGPNTLTAVGMVIGTLAYMSPEQLQAAVVDHRTDIYTLGIIVAEVLTGRLPFGAANMGDMLRAVAEDPFQMEVACAEQAVVAKVLARALEKSPHQRYADIRSFRAALIPALRGCPPFLRPADEVSGSRGAARA